jgi:hypothetical protein
VRRTPVEGRIKETPVEGQVKKTPAEGRVKETSERVKRSRLQGRSSDEDSSRLQRGTMKKTPAKIK